MRSTLVSWALRMSLKQRPISFLETVLTATISLKVLGTPSCLHAMYMQAAAIASLERPLRFLPSWTVLKSLLALSVMVLVRLILSAMLEMVRKALMRVLSELAMLLLLLLYRAFPDP